MEAKQWKEKYDKLAEKIVQNDSNVSNEINLIEELVDEMNEPDSESNSKSRLEYIPTVLDKAFLLKHFDEANATLDLSNIPLNNDKTLIEINKFIQLKQSTHQPPNKLYFVNCQLDDYCHGLMDIVSCGLLVALDLSNNHLSLEFQKNLLECFSVSTICVCHLLVLYLIIC